MTNEQIAQDLVAKFGEDKIYGIMENYGLLNVTTSVDTIVPLLHYLYQHPTFKFQFLTDLAGIHFPDAVGQELGVIYHLHSLENNVRLIIKLYVPIESPKVPTITGLYATANWMEREAFDFYGLIFEGHPNLIRILNVEDMDYHPMRKEYPMEDATRQDKIDALFGR
ncbi:NADH-quinone oxidoreductase subunit C [Flectobacillus longus]|jgi:NADH-quinone oxidoreductase subunit C|uniref:NADH-quinone oxidoreductase subunit C n=1 Tax=Flectobacillus longus TaxID=2984207 RepID=A0ABT6YMM9_9BACT|nr:NADH-quinone oxidoreductase subunit C [Flectobacillus longus]MDI9864831.1 NADH-quinone oxidoreductase subunit C [Flectobacillus longus]MDI9879440.1 NADH-quinone oxidoreductase subunit C [Flectobacillus longus]